MNHQDHENTRGYVSPLSYSSLLCGLLLGAVSLPVAANDTDGVESRQLPALTIWGQASTEDGDAYIANKIRVGSKLPVDPRAIPQSVSVMTRQRIEDQNLTSLEDALKQVTGITAIPNDSAQSQFRSRGYSLNIAIDGIPNVSGLSGVEQFDLAIYDRIEVLRGPAGLFAGSGDPGGMVNVVTKKPRSEFAISGVLSSGSWNNQRGELDITGPLNADGSLRGRFVGIGQDRDFFYDHAQQSKWVGYGVLEYDITHALTLSLTHAVQSNKVDASYSGLPAFSTGQLLDVSRSINPTPAWATSESQTSESVLAIEQRFRNNWALTLKARHLHRDYDWKDTFVWTGVDPDTWTLDYAKPRDFAEEYESKVLDAYVSGSITALGGEQHFLLGYNYDRYTNHYTGGRGTDIIKDVDFFDPAIAEPDIAHTFGSGTLIKQSGTYAQTRLHLLDPLTLVLGGRFSDYEWNNRRIAPSSPTPWRKWEHASNEFTPYGGIVYDFNPALTFYAGYSDIFLPQDARKADGTPLDPRVGQQYELGIKGAGFNDQLYFSLASFRLNDKNRAYPDPDYPNDRVFLQIGEVESRGWEAELSGSPLDGLNLSAGYTRATNRYLKDVKNEGLPMSTAEPEHSLKLWGHYRIQAGTLKGLSLGGGVRAVSEYNGSRGTQLDRKQSGYALFSAVIGYAINDYLILALNGENLTDRVYYESIGGKNTYNIYGAPRNFTLTLRARY